MKFAPFLIFIFLGAAIQVTAQENFNPDKQLLELSGEKANIGITAGYSIAGDLIWSNSAGVACLENQVPFSTRTKTRIASISKNFTAVAIMQLVEQNLIELDASIDKYLSGLPADKNSITIRQLMAHTAGISQYEGQKEIENTIHFVSLEEAMEVFINRPLLYQPGTKYFYTTYGYVVLGRIIEVASKLSYGEYIQKNIFIPAGMSNSGIEMANNLDADQSCLYHHQGKKTKEGKQNDLSNRTPGGGFYSTLEDMMKFGNALLDEKFIKTESLELMLKYQAVEYDGNKYGLGWTLYAPPPNESLVFGHSGGQTGCTSQLMIVGPSKTVVVVLSNTSGTYPDIATLASNLVGYSEASQN